jgi:hypothetical protein
MHVGRMAVLLALAVGVVAPTFVSARHDSETANIKTAALAPYAAYTRADARGLCAAFTIRARHGLAPRASNRRGCAERVGELFRVAAHFRTLPRGSVQEVSVTYVRKRRSSAEARLGFKLTGRVTMVLELTHDDGRWLVSTVPTLILQDGCPPGESCGSGAKMPLFTLGTIHNGVTRRPSHKR